MRQKIISFFLVVFILTGIFPISVFAESPTFTYDDAVTYTKHSSKGVIHTLSFNPNDGYIAMPFAGYAGTSGTLETQYQCAIGKRYGYEVAGIINGGFFGYDPYGILRDINAYSGRLGSAHLPYSGDDIAFFSDGSIKPVSYTLHSTIEIGGRTFTDLIGCFNENRSTQKASAWSTVDQLYYYDSLCGTRSDTCFPGTEILCNKVENTELSIGYTLVGEVVSVKTGTYGGTVGKDQFILYYPDTSNGYTSLVRSVQPGERIRISVKCSDASANASLSEAIGIIPNIGWLVKDGVNRTLIDSTIGTHSVTLATGWTAFGWKEDGTVVFAVSETGKPITMREMAQQLIDMGCRNVVRLDGGGSSAMYLADTGNGSPGYVYNQGRAVSDCMLVLKRSSAVSSELKYELGAKIAECEPAPEYMSEELAHAKSVYEASTSMDADYTHAIMGLSGYRSYESVGWIKQPTDGKSFEMEYAFPNCSFVDVRITSLKTDIVVFQERKSYKGVLCFENEDPSGWGTRFRVELIPGGEESRTHFVLYGDEKNVVTFPVIDPPSPPRPQGLIDVTSKGFSVYWNFSNCSQVVVLIKSIALDREVGSLTLPNDCTYNFSVGDPSWGNEYEVRLIPDGDHSRTYYLRYGDKENLVELPVPLPDGIIPGDLDGNHTVTSDDAIYLLYHTLLPDRFPIFQDADYDGDGAVTSDDAIYLLYYTLLPDRFPIE